MDPVCATHLGLRAAVIRDVAGLVTEAGCHNITADALSILADYCIDDIFLLSRFTISNASVAGRPNRVLARDSEGAVHELMSSVGLSSAENRFAAHLNSLPVPPVDDVINNVPGLPLPPTGVLSASTWRVSLPTTDQSEQRRKLADSHLLLQNQFDDGPSLEVDENVEISSNGKLNDRINFGSNVNSEDDDEMDDDDDNSDLLIDDVGL